MTTVATRTVVRPAQMEDIPIAVKMGLRFIASEYRGVIEENPLQLASFIQQMITQEHYGAFVAESDDVVVGMLGMMVFDHPMSGQRIASELAWWVNEEARGGMVALRLLRQAERWAREHGASMLQMIAPSDRVAQFYTRAGFSVFEVMYQRTL